LPTLTTTASPQKIELGRKLFFDRRLSVNGTMSCAMCHVPEEGFTSNASKLSIGLEGVSLRRNAPTVLNVAWQTKLFHDGREPSLSSVAWSALLHADEMGNPSPDNLLARLRTWPDYASRFEQAFGGAAASKSTLGEAVAAYLRTLVAGDSRFDQWRYANRAEALTPLEQRGFSVFTGAGRCTACHTVNDQSALFADGAFHVTGAGFKPQATSISVELAAGVLTTLKLSDLAAFADPRRPDLGRYDISQQAQDRFAFKTPSLRNVSRTAPYMHDGSLASLEEVVAFYNQGGDDAPGKSPLLTPLNLTVEDQRALVAFLKSLDSQNLPDLISSARAPE
jgi:cytochrome c peroxidase